MQRDSRCPQAGICNDARAWTRISIALRRENGCCAALGTFTPSSPTARAARPKSGAAESWPISTMPRRMARVRVKCSNSASPSLRRMARVSFDRSSLKVPSISSTASLLVEEHVAPHRRIGGGDAGEVAKAAGGEFHHFRRGHLRQFVGGADDGVGDQMRQMAGDREHQVVMVGRHDLDLGAERRPRTRAASRPPRDRCLQAASGCTSG